MSKNNNNNGKEDYVPDIIVDENRGIKYVKGSFFGKVSDAFRVQGFIV